VEAPNLLQKVKQLFQFLQHTQGPSDAESGVRPDARRCAVKRTVPSS
jgi:hypothetical protein